MIIRTFARMIFAIGCGLFWLGSLQAQPGNQSSDEYLLLGNPDRGAGEPWVFVNPKDSNNIIVAAMATMNRLPTGEAPIIPRTSPEGVALRIKELSVPDGSRTDIAVTRDGGKTWTFSQDNFRKFFDKNRCSDSFAGAGSDGSLYIGCLAYESRGDADYANGHVPGGEPRISHGGSAIARSDDKGKTWSNPVWVHPLMNPTSFSPSVQPVLGRVSPSDRPDFVVDMVTDTIYVSGNGLAYTSDPDAAKGPSAAMGLDLTRPARSRTFVRASHDRGKTWGIIYTFDSDDYPSSGFGGSFSAAFGNLVVAYNASKIRAGMDASCPCALLGISEDDGKNFHYKLIPPLPKDEKNTAELARPGRLPGISVAADPIKEGRYSILRAVGKRMMVSVTEDRGKTWLPPVLAAEVPENASFGQNAFKYSPKGDIGLIWKQMYPDKSYDVWSAASRDGGRTFKAVRISHAISPTYIPGRGNFMLGDDLSSMDMDGEYLYAVWGDNRSGFEGTWFGRVPLSSY